MVGVEAKTKARAGGGGTKAAAASVRGEGAPSKRDHALQDLSWPEFRARLADNPPILLPLGSQEQQGPHAPMGDYVLAERLALAAAERAGAICAPVLPFGHADFFRGAAGGVQLRAATFNMLLEDMVTAFLDHGLSHIVVCNGHSTNAPLIAQVAHKIRRERGIMIASLNLWRMIPDSLWEEVHGAGSARARGHGADPVTSVGLHLTPELMRMGAARPSMRANALGLPSTSQFAGVTFGGFEVALPLDVTEVASNGVGAGDPTLASAEAGARFSDFIVEAVADFTAHFRRCDPARPHLGPQPS
ncbi:creatininase family protein [Sphingopyxis soli]|uniref:Creatininase family protein n=1 Tax=Sphingopyxis soli TaxID=592051 RepID=A0ABN1LUW0_9SPHN|nr:creatininase family protein [Sphingopyxis soli]